MNTSDITRDSLYFNTPTKFFRNFSTAFKSVKAEILKVETRQVYDESGNPSFDLLMKGNFNESLLLIPEVRKEDKELFDDLNSRNIEFKRVRPIEIPLSNYLKWEIHCYFENDKMGEEIRFFENSLLKGNLSSVQHDFMLFDNKLGFIHDYDKNGKIQGGWIVEDAYSLKALKSLFGKLYAHSIDYKDFIQKENLNIQF